MLINLCVVRCIVYSWALHLEASKIKLIVFQVEQAARSVADRVFVRRTCSLQNVIVTFAHLLLGHVSLANAHLGDSSLASQGARGALDTGALIAFLLFLLAVVECCC